MTLFAATAVDAASLAFALLSAYALRFNFAIPEHHLAAMPRVFCFTVALELALLAAFGCRRAVWRWFSASDLPPLLAALAASSALSLCCRLAFKGLACPFYAPISINLMNLAMSICALAGVRWLRRIAAERGGQVAPTARRSAIVGTGPASLSAAYALRHEIPPSRRVVGFVDDGHAQSGASIQGLPVLASLDDAPESFAPFPIDEFVVPKGVLDRDGMRRLLEISRETGVRIAVAPGYASLLDGGTGGAALRDADITDILKRGEIPQSTFAAHRDFLEGRRVLVSGAGGSIGSEIARQALAAGAARLVLVERGELPLFDISRELASSPNAAALARYIADVGDGGRIARILDAEKPDIVFHAAAYKHVPLMEENPCEAVRNNVFGTLEFARRCEAAGAGTFVLLSSDKAVEPSSVMGATKRACELALMGMNGGATRFTAVRFGNVLGSTGSVVPVFREQILRGGPVTVTHPAMERFFMTIPEAASLTIVAAAMAAARPGRAFVLDMGEPVKIVGLAENMIRLAGKIPGRDVKIVFSGVRPGEKMSERLVSDDEPLEPTGDARISCFRIEPAGQAALDAFLGAMRAALGSGDNAAARAALFGFAKGGGL